MTANELRAKLEEYRFPATFEVDAVTYGAAFQVILAWVDEDPINRKVWHGKHGGLMFKNVELIRT